MVAGLDGACSDARGASTTSGSTGNGGSTAVAGTSSGDTTSSSGNGGGATAGSTVGSGGGDAGPGSFAAVQVIFETYCVTCHDASKQGLPAYPSLSLVAADAYGQLVGKAADETCGGQRVVPGSPDTSYLIQKLGAGSPCSGAHMPRPFEIGPSGNIPSDELATIRSWIATGAAP